MKQEVPLGPSLDGSSLFRAATSYRNKAFRTAGDHTFHQRAPYQTALQDVAAGSSFRPQCYFMGKWQHTADEHDCRMEWFLSIPNTAPPHPNPDSPQTESGTQGSWKIAMWDQFPEVEYGKWGQLGKSEPVNGKQYFQVTALPATCASRK